MRIEPIRNTTSGRRSAAGGAGASSAAERTESRALAVVEAATDVSQAKVERRSYRSGTVSAALVAHLIATRDGLAQTRNLRRVSSEEGSAAYGTVRSIVKATPPRQKLSITA